MSLLLTINPDNPEGRKLDRVVETLRAGGVIIYPTDTVYAFGCLCTANKAIDQISRLRGLDPKKALYSIMCEDISQAANYTAQIDNHIFRLIKNHTPGPFTFILKGGKQLSKLLKNRKGSIGVRIPDNQIAQEVVRLLGEPMMTASLKIEDDEIQEYLTNPSLIFDTYQKQVDLVIDGGLGGLVPSTIVDCTVEPPLLVREGQGILQV